MKTDSAILATITIILATACGGEESYPPPCGEGTVERGGVCYALPSPNPEVKPSLTCGEGTKENNGFCMAKTEEAPKINEAEGPSCEDHVFLNAPCVEISTGHRIKGKFVCLKNELTCKPDAPSPEKCDGYYDEDQDGELDEGCHLSECKSETDCMSGLKCIPYNTGSPKGICIRQPAIQKPKAEFMQVSLDFRLKNVLYIKVGLSQKAKVFYYYKEADPGSKWWLAASDVNPSTQSGVSIDFGKTEEIKKLSLFVKLEARDKNGEVVAVYTGHVTQTP